MNKPRTTRLDQGRFFDDGDFTSEHDVQFLWILEHYPEVVNAAIKDTLPGWSIGKDSEIRGEPPLDGYPTVFPDAIVTGKLVADHQDVAPQVSIVEVDKYSFGSSGGRKKVGVKLSCQGRSCQTTETIKFAFKKDDWLLSLPALVQEKKALRERRRVLELEENPATRYQEESLKKNPSWKYDSVYYEKFNSAHERYSELSADENKLDKLCEAEYEKAYEEAFDAWSGRISESPPHFKEPCFKGDFYAVIELKPKCDSFGKVLRQLKIYETRIGGRREAWPMKLVILVTGDTSFDAAFKSQGIFVFHIPAVPGMPNGD